MINLMLDSGAFSCWRQQKDIDLDAYLDFILEHESSIAVPVGLDVIPGERGAKPTPAQLDSAAREGYDNAIYARARGVEVMPVFHQGEDFGWLKQMVTDGFAWIGISPRNDGSTKSKIVWLDRVFSYLCGDEGYPRMRVHGFGVTAPYIMCRYPWCTVDSMSWLLQASVGNIIVPRRKDSGDWNFINPLYLPMSVRSEGSSAPASRPGNHWGTLGGLQREAILMYLGELEQTVGIDLSIAVLEREYVLRDVVNICTFLRVLEDNPLRRFRRRRGGFHDVSETCGGRSVPMWERTRLLFGVTPAPFHGWALNRCGVLDRLLTYFYLRGNPFSMAAYTRSGSIEIAKYVSETDCKEGILRDPVFSSRRPGEQGLGPDPQ